MEYSEVYLKKQFFKSARQNKVEVFEQTMAKVTNDEEKFDCK